MQKLNYPDRRKKEKEGQRDKENSNIMLIEMEITFRIGRIYEKCIKTVNSGPFYKYAGLESLLVM